MSRLNLASLISGLFKQPTIPDPVEHNEHLLEGNTYLSRDVATALKTHLIPHPSIECTFSVDPDRAITMDYYYHGRRPAIWRRDMSHPLCIRCMAENPYE